MYLQLLRYIVIFLTTFSLVTSDFDICGTNNGKLLYLQKGEFGLLHADCRNNNSVIHNTNSSNKRCSIKFITCSSCIIQIDFRPLNISRNCEKTSPFDTGNCNEVWICEPPIENAPGEQFCEKVALNNASEFNYTSQTRNLEIVFVYNDKCGYAFSLHYCSKRNRVQISGYPKFSNINNLSLFISSPLFPYMYPNDLSTEYVFTCERTEMCRISLLFTDFLLAKYSIMFFDWSGGQMDVISGNIFRPPVITSIGPTLTIRFHANDVSGIGFKAFYSFIPDVATEMFMPNLECGGFVKNFGGTIMMMNMTKGGTAFFDCIWIIKPSENISHSKTYLYVKVVHFLDFADATELVIREGLTSTEPSVEVLRYPPAEFSLSKQNEHVVPITRGFYISLRGHFKPESRLTIAFATFDYKNCFGGSDFLCNNMRCISSVLNCDGFDHCGDNSDELSPCLEDHRRILKTPNFLFPKMEQYSDIATAILVFLTCTFGLIGIILAMALLLYRVNIKARHQRQIQDHIETIHAILEENVGEVVEEIIIPDDPPDYEAPPDYEEIVNLNYLKDNDATKLTNKQYSHCNLPKNAESLSEAADLLESGNTDPACFISASHATRRSQVQKPPASPPPSYGNVEIYIPKDIQPTSYKASPPSVCGRTESSLAGPSYLSFGNEHSAQNESTERKSIKYFESVLSYRYLLLRGIRKSFRNSKSINLMKRGRKEISISLSEENLVTYFSDTELTFFSTTGEHCWVRRSSKLKRSFSTDDISLLL